MGDPLQHVQPGSPLMIQAEAWNRIVDAAGRSEGSRRFDGGAGDARRIPTRPAVYIDVKNTTGGSVANRAILSPTGVVVDPATNPDLAADGPTVVAAAPTSDSDPVLIAVQPIPAGTVGRAVVAGVTVAQVSVTSTSHRFARPIAGTSTHLASAATGPVRLLVPPTTTGTQMVYVLLGGAGTSASDGGGGTDGNCSGDGWRVGLTPDDEWALRVLPDDEPVYIGDDATVEINGVEYTIDFNYATPSLTLTSALPSAAPIVGTLDCTACPCLKFSFPRFAFGLDATVPRGFCARVFYITVCQYCPAGWYCAREFGTDGLFQILELLEGEACSGDWEINSGPHESEYVARQHCGSNEGCGPSPLGAANIFTLDLTGMNLHTDPGDPWAPCTMCDDWARVWRFINQNVYDPPGGCFWQNAIDYDVYYCGGIIGGGGNPFARLHLGLTPDGVHVNRLFWNFGTATWTYWALGYGGPAWDARSPLTLYLLSGPGVGGAPQLYCQMPPTITIYPV